MVTWSTVMPRSASSSSTSRYDSPKRRSQRTARTITSDGKQKPAKADCAMVGRVDEGSCDSLPAQGSLAAGATVLVRPCRKDTAARTGPVMGLRQPHDRREPCLCCIQPARSPDITNQTSYVEALGGVSVAW